MTVVYIDVLFLLNLIVDYLLLLATARITGEMIVRWRMMLAACSGAAYSAMLFLPGGGWLSQPLCKIASAVLIVLVAFGGSRKLLRLLFVFAGVSAALGGIVLALQLLGTGGLTLENGVLYTGFDVRILLVTVILSYVMMSIVFERAALHGGRRQDLNCACVTLEERMVSFTVLTDTGNTLRDPIYNRPVMVVEAQVMRGLLPEGIDPADPVASMEHMNESDMRSRFRLLPYRAVGVAQGMLLAVRTDKVAVGKKEWKEMLIALSPTPVSDGGGYQALIGEV